MLGAVLLTGGRGSRLGGVDKGAIRVDGTTLLHRALEALRGLPTVVVGPGTAPAVVVREDPPFAGPAAAVVAGLAALRDVDEVLLLAVDVPRLPEAVPLLRRAPLDADGLVAVDGAGRTQWLLGRYRADALLVAAAALGDPRDRSLRALLGALDVVPLSLPPGLADDIDTVDDARRARAVLPPTREEAP